MSTDNQNTDDNREIVAHEGPPPSPFHKPQVEVKIAKAGPIVGPQPIAQVTNGDEIVSTARKANGSHIYSGSITGDDIVTVRGIDMRVRQAVEMGFLREDGAGGYAAVKGADPIGKAREAEAARQAAEYDARSADLPLASDETTALLSDWGSACAKAGVPIQSVIAGFMQDPNTLPKSVEAMAYAYGRPVHEVLAEGRALVAGVAESIGAWLVERGVSDPDAFFDWAVSSDVRGFSNRVGALLLQHDPRPLRELAARFLKDTNHGLTEADHRTPVKVKVQGRVIETSRAYAVKQGLRIL
jgi:hypothetical protein